MKLLVLSTWCPFPPDNGSKIRAYYLLRALAEAYRTTLISFCPSLDAQQGTLQNVEFHPVLASAFRYVQLPRIVKYVSPVPLVFWRIKEMETALVQLQNEREWDAIVAVQAPAARYALRFCGVPRILDVDTALSYQLRERYYEQRTRTGRWRAWLSWFKAYRYERALFQRFHICTVVSPLEVTNVQAMAGASTRVVVLPNGVDCAHHLPGLAEAQPHTLVYNGALTYSANYDAMQYLLAEIYPLIKYEVPDVALTITGSTKGVDMSGLRKDASVHFTGYVEDVRIPVAQSAVCIVPLRQGSGTRLKILEAMALGTPVVATCKGAEGLDIADGEHLLLGDTPAAFAGAVLRVLSDAALRERLRRNARALVEQQYDWDVIGAQSVALLEEAVKGQMNK